MVSQSKKIFIKQFFLELFDIGYSTGSLFSQILGVFKTFQRFSASQSFSTRFSDQCLKLFEWAKDLYNYVLNFVPMDPFTDFELFYTYTFAFPLFLLVFISTLKLNYKILLFLVIFGLFSMLGIGFGYIGINLKICLSLIIISSVMITIGIILKIKRCCRCITNPDNNTATFFNVKHLVPFTYSLITAFSVFSVIVIPISISRSQLIIYFVILSSCVLILCFIIELIILCCWRNNFIKNLKKTIEKVISFVINLLTLLIIPSTDYFVKIMRESYKKDWNCIVSFIGVGLLLPIIYIYFMIRNEVQDIKNKYNQSKYGFFNYYYIEIIDVVKQVAYALLSAYDLYLGCILLEISWVMLIFSLFPYQKKSEYSLSLGNSVVMFISNGAMIYSSLNDDAILGNAISIFFVVLSCVPAVASLYIYFIIDFEFKPDEKSEEVLDDINDDEMEVKIEINKTTSNMANNIVSLTPIAFFLYGLSISLFTKDNKL